MFPDLLLNTHNLGPEVRFAPGMVTSHIQIESVEIGEGRNRNKTANNKEGRGQSFEQKISQWPQYFERNTAEKTIKYLTNT